MSAVRIGADSAAGTGADGTAGTRADSAAGIGAMLVTSRSFEEYVAMFALGTADLSGTVLDCPAGASSFTAGAHRVGTRATACDIAYGNPRAVLDSLRPEVERGNRYIAAHPDGYSDRFFGGPAEHLAHRLAAAELFTHDFLARPESYVHAALPELPFDDRSFDLVLSSHLLFSYADRLDVETHLVYLTELLRVARDQIRIFPLVPTGSSARYPQLGELRELLGARGVDTTVTEVDYEFQRGGTEMLVCRRR
ncbi:methyltransferase domain-containing protein [Rhodococcus kronopolitis]|uniref:Methyltransferase domain-containing protein n=1 Tax=Rhodococcus kronopolitis TaxID=1460226 RepID=A0ABV9FME0_9NOCA